MGLIPTAIKTAELFQVVQALGELKSVEPVVAVLIPSVGETIFNATKTDRLLLAWHDI